MRHAGLRRGVVMLAAFSLSALLFPRVLMAQRPHRSGFWAELGSGPSQIRIACSGCADVTRSSGPGGHVRVGGAVSDGVMLGVESYSLINEDFGFGEGDSTLIAENTSITGIVLWFPWSADLFVKGGIGIATGRFTVETTSGEPLVSQGVGTGMTFGVGFDLPVWRGLALTGNAGGWVTAIGDVVLPDLTVDDVIATLYSLTFGFTIR